MRILVSGIEGFAGVLTTRGIGVDDVIGLFCPNVPVLAVTFHGILRAGATAATVRIGAHQRLTR